MYSIQCERFMGQTDNHFYLLPVIIGVLWNDHQRRNDSTGTLMSTLWHLGNNEGLPCAIINIVFNKHSHWKTRNFSWSSSCDMRIHTSCPSVYCTLNDSVFDDQWKVNSAGCIHEGLTLLLLGNHHKYPSSVKKSRDAMCTLRVILREHDLWGLKCNFPF